MRLFASARGAFALLALLALAAVWTAGCGGVAEPQKDTFNFEGNWSAVFTVVSTNGALVDQECRLLAVGDRLTPAIAIAQDGDSIVLNVLPSERWPAFRLVGKADGKSFDGVGEFTAGCGQVLRLGLRGEQIDNDSLSGESTGTRAGLTGKMVFSARRS